MGTTSVKDYLKNCHTADSVITLEDNLDGTWTLTVDGQAILLTKFVVFGNGVVHDVPAWPNNADTFTIVKDAAGKVLGFTFNGVKYPLDCCVAEAPFTDSDARDVVQVEGEKIAAKWSLIYNNTTKYAVGIVNPDGDGRLFMFPPLAPIVIPGTEFSDVEDPLPAEVNAWVPSGDQIGQLYYYNRPSGTGTADDPDYVWYHDGDGTATNIEAPLDTDTPKTSIGSQASNYDPLSPPGAPEGTNIPSSPTNGSLHHTGYQNFYLIQWNYSSGVWNGPVVIEKPEPAVTIVEFNGYTANYAEAQLGAVQVKGQGPFTYQWYSQYDGGATNPEGTSITQDFTLPDTWQQLRYTLAVTDSIGQGTTTTAVIFAPPFLQDTLVVSPTGNDTTAVAAFRALGGTGIIWDSSKPFATLEAAVTASAPGDTIIVKPGTYPVAASVNIAERKLIVENARIEGDTGIVIFDNSGYSGNTETSIIGVGNSTIASDAALVLLSQGAAVTDILRIKDIRIEGYSSISLSRKRTVTIQGGTTYMTNVKIEDGHLLTEATDTDPTMGFIGINNHFVHGVSHIINPAKSSGSAAKKTVEHRDTVFNAFGTDNHVSTTSVVAAIVIAHSATDAASHELTVDIDNCRIECLTGSNRAITWGSTDGVGSGTAGSYNIYVRNVHAFVNHGTLSTLTESAVNWEVSGTAVVNKDVSANTTTKTSEGTWTYDSGRTK